MALSPNKIRFICPFCEVRVAAPSERSGVKMRCPGCKSAVVVPSVSTPNLDGPNRQIKAIPDRPQRLEISASTAVGPSTSRPQAKTEIPLRRRTSSPSDESRPLPHGENNGKERSKTPLPPRKNEIPVTSEIIPERRAAAPVTPVAVPNPSKSNGTKSADFLPGELARDTAVEKPSPAVNRTRIHTPDHQKSRTPLSEAFPKPAGKDQHKQASELSGRSQSVEPRAFENGDSVAPEIATSPETEAETEPDAQLALTSEAERIPPPQPDASAKLELARELDAAAEVSMFSDPESHPEPTMAPDVRTHSNGTTDPKTDVSSERGLLLDDQWLLFYCPNCSNLIKIDSEKTGTTVACAGCHQEFSLEIDSE